MGIALDLVLGIWASNRQAALVHKQNIEWLTPGKYFPKERKESSGPKKPRDPSKAVLKIAEMLGVSDPDAINKLLREVKAAKSEEASESPVEESVSTTSMTYHELKAALDSGKKFEYTTIGGNGNWHPCNDPALATHGGYEIREVPETPVEPTPAPGTFNNAENVPY